MNLDAYGLKARYYPALLATIPSLTALAILISWSRFGLTTVVASAAIPVLVFASADIARRLGKRLENRIFQLTGGKPSVVMLRFSDGTFDKTSKKQYRTFLAAKINQPIPLEAAEKSDVTAGDAFYERCSAWLRENTRDTKKFSVLFAENITYGFRRNLLGLKWPALGANLVLILLCTVLLFRRAPIDTGDDTTMRLVVVVVLAVLHSFYMIFAVTQKGVIAASRSYARQLILSCESFIGQTSSTRQSV